jgi:hypothetical protein
LTVTLSAALLLGVVVFLLCKYAGLKIWHAAACVILGSTSPRPASPRIYPSSPDPEACSANYNRNGRKETEITKITACPAQATARAATRRRP